MLGFGGEKYSKEAYKNAEADRDHALAREKDRVLLDVQNNDYPHREFEGYAPFSAANWRRNSEEAKGRIEKLYGKGQAEANALNEEYDRLMASTLEAVKALQEFEKNKLGMSEETVH